MSERERKERPTWLHMRNHPASLPLMESSSRSRLRVLTQSSFRFREPREACFRMMNLNELGISCRSKQPDEREVDAIRGRESQLELDDCLALSVGEATVRKVQRKQSHLPASRISSFVSIALVKNVPPPPMFGGTPNEGSF